MIARSITILSIALSAKFCAAQQEPIWQADFAQPNAGFTRYHGEDSPVQVSLLEEDGVGFVRAVAPGEQRLEGLSINTPAVLPGGTRATIRAEVRGSGEVWLMANSRNGWLYARDTHRLTDDWQAIAITKPLAIADDRMTICLLIREPAPMTLDVRSLTVTIEPAPQTWDVEVAPVRLEAEELSQFARDIGDAEGASGRAVVTSRRYAVLSAIPCPRTSRPIHLFARVRMPGPRSAWSVVGGGGGTQRINQMTGADTRAWQWITGEPFTAAMVGDSFDLVLYGAQEEAGDAVLDCIVLTTAPEPTEAELDAAPVLPAIGQPTLTIGRAAATPTLDGRADDACWRDAVALTGFTRTSSTGAAQHASEMRLCWDHANLYWWFRGEEPVLRTEMQRLQDFRRVVTERDGNVWADDSVLLVLDTGAGLFDLFVNALGTVNDARIGSPLDMWGSRDESFDADVQSVSEVGEGYWTVEARIGLDSLGVKAPAPGEAWRFLVGRIEKADGETSGWTPLAPGLHDPRGFAALRFAETALGATLTPPEPLQPGRNELTCALGPGAGGALLGASVRTDASLTRAWAFGAAGEQFSTPVQVEGEGKVSFGYALLDARSMAPLLVSPAFERSVRSSTAQVVLTTDRPWRLLLNQEPQASGDSAAGEPITLFLSRGVNAFGLELAGEATVRIKAGDLVITGADPWRIAPDEVGDPSLVATDPRTWQVAQAGAGGAIGPGRLRFEVLWEDTRIFPNSQPALFIATGTPQHLMVAARGLPHHLLEDYRCHFWLPAPLELVGVTGYYGRTREEQPEYAVERIGDEQIEGQPYAHYVVTADQPIPYRESVRILELFDVYFAWTVAEPEDREWALYWASEALGGSIREARRSLMVRPLPPLHGAQPQRLVWQLWGSFFSSMDSAAARELSLQTARAAGFNNIVAGDLETAELGDRYGIDDVLAVNFASWSIGMGPWVAEHPESAQVNRAGEASNAYACTSALLDEAYPVVDARLKSLIAERHPDWVTWDFEYGVLTGEISCFCPRCLQAFRTAAGIADEVPLDGAIIERDFLPQWTAFMNRRMAQLALRFKETCHAAQPPARLQVYSGYQSDDTKWRYGVDWAMIGELQACDVASCGYGRSWELVRATHEALQGIPLIVGELMHPYDRNSDDAVTPCTRAVLLRRLMDCTGGVLVYDRPPMEGRSWRASAEVTRLAAAHEEVFAEGEFASLEGVPDGAEWAGARRLGDTMIVALMNTSGQARQFSLTLPGGYGRCSEFFSGVPAKPGTELTLELAGGDARAWVLTR
ncbi:MAG: hypothetical protein AB7Y46_03285 [Armatimonadota bacterium]